MVLEDHVFCGPSMVFTNVVNPRSEIVRKDEYQTTLVRRGASLGANSTIVCGVTIGQYAFVGAGAVVTRDVPDFALVVGNPARRDGLDVPLRHQAPGRGRGDATAVLRDEVPHARRGADRERLKGYTLAWGGSRMAAALAPRPLRGAPQADVTVTATGDRWT